MPWYIKDEHNGIWTVRNQITQRILGRHLSYESALRQLRLLYYKFPFEGIKKRKLGK
jgi:hypothetical protein